MFRSSAREKVPRAFVAMSTKVPGGKSVGVTRLEKNNDRRVERSPLLKPPSLDGCAMISGDEILSSL
jgi:hypothetical protein